MERRTWLQSALAVCGLGAMASSSSAGAVSKTAAIEGMGLKEELNRAQQEAKLMQEVEAAQQLGPSRAEIWANAIWNFCHGNVQLLTYNKRRPLSLVMPDWAVDRDPPKLQDLAAALNRTDHLDNSVWTSLRHDLQRAVWIVWDRLVAETPAMAAWEQLQEEGEYNRRLSHPDQKVPPVFHNARLVTPKVVWDVDQMKNVDEGAKFLAINLYGLVGDCIQELMSIDTVCELQFENSNKHFNRPKDLTVHKSIFHTKVEIYFKEEYFHREMFLYLHYSGCRWHSPWTTSA